MSDALQHFRAVEALILKSLLQPGVSDESIRFVARSVATVNSPVGAKDWLSTDDAKEKGVSSIEYLPPRVSHEQILEVTHNTLVFRKVTPDDVFQAIWGMNVQEYLFTMHDSDERITIT